MSLIRKLKNYYYMYMYYNTLNTYFTKILYVKIPFNKSFNSKFKYLSIVYINNYSRLVTIQYSRSRDMYSKHTYNPCLVTHVLDFNEAYDLLYKQNILNTHILYNSGRDKLALASYYKNQYTTNTKYKFI